MNEITTTTETTFGAVLDNYANQGRFFLSAAASSLVQFGRVLTEAKPYVPHGQWENWVSSSFGMNVRSAQSYMKAWQKFGDNPQLQNVQYSKLREMLALPDGTQDRFIAENDLNEMTSREVKEAVNRVREELNGELERERKARQAAERRAQEILSMPSEADEQLMEDLKQKQTELDERVKEMERLKEIADDAINRRNDMGKQLAQAHRELSEAEEMIRENQDEYNRLQTELLNAQSAIAKGDAERHISERMSAEEFAAAVRSFMGAVSQMPYMGSAFALLSDAEHEIFDQYLCTVEGWAQNARRALDTISGEVYDL